MTSNETSRLFVAIVPPAQIVKRLRDAASALAKQLPPRAVRWTQTEKLHLTLNFLGEVEVARVPEIRLALQSACKGHFSHQVRVAGFGAFPNRSRPQIIWVGLTGDSRPVEKLKKSVDAHLGNFEDRPFRPHLTLGRAAAMNPGARKSLAKFLDEQTDCDFGPWRIERVDLVQSVLSSQGSTYTTIDSNLLKSKS
jgi:2'-5' RNA ligase